MTAVCLYLSAANATLITALMFYMGWAYMNSWLGYFNVGAFSVGFTVPEFVLESLSLFSPGLIVAGAAVAVAAGARSWVPVPRPIRCYLLRSGKLARPVGLALSAAGVILAVLAYHVRINTYVVVFFIGSGLLLSRWPARHAGNLQPAADRIARIAAVLITGSCAFWNGRPAGERKGHG